MPNPDEFVEVTRSRLLEVKLTGHAHEGLVRLVHISGETQSASDHSMLCSVERMMLV
jgi:hypothetical protein